MRLLTSNSMLMMERSVDYLWTKQSAILDNIANVETPNYKAKYVTFEDTLQSKLEQANGNILQVREQLETASPVVHTAEEESARADGNGVDLTTQNVELIRNAYQQQHVYNAISSELSLLRTAITGQ